MGKGNPLMNQLRGKVGGMVFTRLAGEQVVRARNTQPKNPQTTKQMAQRAAMATCVEFFTRGKKNLFKFAFENKRAGESDYNAFVRANIKTIPVQSKKTLDQNGPIFGEIVLSQGSLPQPAFKFDNDAPYGALICSALPHSGEALTIAELSQAIIDVNGLQDGDIITIVGIANKDSQAYTELDVAIDKGYLADPMGATKWIIKQFTLDVTSSDKASTLGIYTSSEITEGATQVPLVLDAEGSVNAEESYIAMLGVIASRPSVTGLKVSSSTLVCGYGALDASGVGQDDAWKIWVARNWNTASSLDVQPENILEGSLSEN